jgi:CxxC motif-containing protein (DUF1111 family)
MTMNGTKINASCRYVLSAITAIVLVSAAAAADRTSLLDEGRDLFVRQFVFGNFEAGGDGLGPLFNHVSCAACHRQGAIGGGGGIEFNVSLLSAQLVNPGSRPRDKALLMTLREFHPALVTPEGKIVPNILLHRFGPDERYFLFKNKFGMPHVPLEPDELERDELQKRVALEPLPTAKSKSGLRLIRAQRNTTALFGAGLIDQLPDHVLYALAEEQGRMGSVSGRVPPIGPDKVGRFGWRGQQEHLLNFVLGACANELGLQVTGNPQPMNPLMPKYTPKGLDLTDAQCEALTAFVAALPYPRIVVPEDAEEREAARRGRSLFASIGCAACHVEQVGTVTGIYSDLLLHDMGPGLADPVLAEATLIFVKQHLPHSDDPFVTVDTSITRSSRPEPASQPTPPNNYYGGSSFQSLSLAGSPPTTVTITDPKTGIATEYRVQATSLDREWRTPPLWGLADSAPYLHDGRAATITEAIRLHGGEADAATTAFLRLPAKDQAEMLRFFNCLRVPVARMQPL